MGVVKVKPRQPAGLLALIQGITFLVILTTAWDYAIIWLSILERKVVAYGKGLYRLG